MNATFTLDGTAVAFEDGDTLMAAARRAGHYIPHLCWHPTLGQSGACRLCTVKVDGRLAAACTTRAAPGPGGGQPHARARRQAPAAAADAVRRRQPLLPQLREERRLPAAGQRLRDGHDRAALRGVLSRSARSTPATPTCWLDLNRCILCKLCVRASHEVDGKDVFAIGGHGIGIAPARQLAQRPPGRQRLRRRRPGRPGLPGGRHPAQAPGLRGADRPAPLRPRTGVGRAGEPTGDRRWPAAEPAHAQAARGHRLAGRLLRLPHVAAGHRRAPVRAGRADRVRPLAADRHQALRPLRHRPDRGRPVQRRERARAARVPRPLQGAGGGGRLRHHRRPAGAAQRTWTWAAS